MSFDLTRAHVLHAVEARTRRKTKAAGLAARVMAAQPKRTKPKTKATQPASRPAPTLAGKKVPARLVPTFIALSDAYYLGKPVPPGMTPIEFAEAARIGRNLQRKGNR